MLVWRGESASCPHRDRTGACPTKNRASGRSKLRRERDAVRRWWKDRPEVKAPAGVFRVNSIDKQATRAGRGEFVCFVYDARTSSRASKTANPYPAWFQVKAKCSVTCKLVQLGSLISYGALQVNSFLASWQPTGSDILRVQTKNW